MTDSTPVACHRTALVAMSHVDTDLDLEHFGERYNEKCGVFGVYVRILCTLPRHFGPRPVTQTPVGPSRRVVARAIHQLQTRVRARSVFHAQLARTSLKRRRSICWQRCRFLVIVESGRSVRERRRISELQVAPVSCDLLPRFETSRRQPATPCTLVT